MSSVSSVSEDGRTGNSKNLSLYSNTKKKPKNKQTRNYFTRTLENIQRFTVNNWTFNEEKSAETQQESFVVF